MCHMAKKRIVIPITLPNLNNRQFNPHVVFIPSENPFGIHSADITSEHPDNSHFVMGSMDWRAKKGTGEILGLHVEPPLRRKGIASTLFHQARAIARDQGLTPPEHSKFRSKDGDAWAQTTGTAVPELSPTMNQG